MGDFEFSITKPYYTNREKKNKGSGGLFSITINPYTCKGCMLCIDVCEDDALLAEPQTKDDIERLRKDWKFWMDLPTTQQDFIRIDDIDEKVGALETLLLDKSNYQSVVAGDGACLGCGEKTSIHLFTSAVTALMKPRVIKHLAKLDELIEKVETHIRMKLAENVDLSNLSSFNDAIDKNKDNDLTLASLSTTLEEGLFEAIETQLVEKFGSKGRNVVEDNLRVVRRGFDEIIEITNKEVGMTPEMLKKQQASKIPMMLKHLPEGNGGLSDVHRFWEHTGSFYLQGKGNDNLAEPFMATSIIPAATGIYRDMTNIRFEYPKFVTENCTACGECFSVCPDSAIPGLVNTIAEVFNTAIQNIE